MKIKSTKFFFIFIAVLIIGWSGVFIFNKGIFKSYEEVVAPSGVKILFLKEKNLPYVYFSIWFLKAGSDYDPPNKSGLNFITAHLLEQGAGGFSSEEIQDQLDYLGASFNAQTRHQYSRFSMSGLSWQEKKLWNIFFKIITEAHLEEGEFHHLKQRLIEARYSKLDDPDSVADEVWRQLLFPENSPAGQPEEGTVTSLNQISLEDIKRFFKNHYVESRPIVTVVGQFSSSLKKEILASFEQVFTESKLTNSTNPMPKKASFFKLLKKKDQLQSQIRLGFQSLSFPEDQPRLSVALDLATLILGGGGLNNRLMNRLREEMGLTYGVWSFLSLGRSYGLFQLGAQTKTKNTVVFVEETLKILKQFQDQGVTDTELKMAKPMLKSRYLQRIDIPEKFLTELIYYRDYLGTSATFFEDYLSIIEDISLEEVNEAIKTYLKSENLSIFIYGDPSIEKKLLKIPDLPPLESLSFEDYFSKDLKK